MIQKSDMDKMNEDKNGDPNENQNQAKADALFLTPRKTDLSLII